MQQHTKRLDNQQSSDYNPYKMFFPESETCMIIETIANDFGVTMKLQFIGTRNASNIHLLTPTTSIKYNGLRLQAIIDDQSEISITYPDQTMLEVEVTLPTCGLLCEED